MQTVVSSAKGQVSTSHPETIGNSCCFFVPGLQPALSAALRGGILCDTRMGHVQEQRGGRLTPEGLRGDVLTAHRYPTEWLFLFPFFFPTSIFVFPCKPAPRTHSVSPGFQSDSQFQHFVLAQHGRSPRSSPPQPGTGRLSSWGTYATLIQHISSNLFHHTAH